MTMSTGNFMSILTMWQLSKPWVAKVRARTHVCVCMRNDFLNMCAMCVRAGTFKLVTHHTRATHTFCKLTFFSTIFGLFQNQIEHSKAGKDVLKQKRIF